MARLKYYIKYNQSCKDFYGRGRRIRTLGTRFWRPLLYQLSYTPIYRVPNQETHLRGDPRRNTPHPAEGLVGLQGLEPGTNRL